MRAFLKNFTRLFLILTIIAIAGFVWFLRASVPAKNATYELAGLKHTIEIIKDGHGIPYVKATTREDAAFAMGFLHAQDRLFQMDMMRRYASGELSEVFGKRTLKTDKFMRTLRFRARAKEDFTHFSPHVKKALEAYANGVNAYMNNKHEKPAPEFFALGYDPKPWTVVDSILWQKNMALTLSHNWKHDLLRGRMSKIIAPEDFNKFWPPTPEDSPVTIPGKKIAPKLFPAPDAGSSISSEMHAKASNTQPTVPLHSTGPLPSQGNKTDAHIPDPTQASNAWVLSGKHTTSGKPLLANDPHLKLSNPSTWYLIRVDLPDMVLAGASAPGIPGIILGRNTYHAWGCTTTRGEVQDIFIEKLHPEQANQYKTPEGYQHFKEFHEEIKIKGRSTQKLVVRETRHGVVLNDVIDKVDIDPKDEVYVMSWTGLHPQDKTVESLYMMNYGKSIDDFKEALKFFHSPQQNVHYADIKGNIGFAAPTRLPQRKKGDGLLPVPGWTGEYDWQEEYVPFVGIPQLFNPEDGIIFNANNKVVQDSHPYYVTKEYDNPPLRAKRLESLLKSKEKFNILDMRNFQMDIKTLLYDEFRPYIEEARPKTEGGLHLKKALLSWDGTMHKDLTEPLMFEAWTKLLHEVAFKDQIGPLYTQYMMWKPEAIRHVLADGKARCSDAKDPLRSICTNKMGDAMDMADKLLTEHFGSNRKGWHWGRAHKVKFKNDVITNIPLLNQYSDREIETSGHRYTLNEGGTYVLPFEDFSQKHGPGYRAIYDLGNLDGSLYMITPGQSGHFLSSHYHDLVEKWEAGLYVRLPKKPIGRSGTLTLKTKKEG